MARKQPIKTKEKIIVFGRYPEPGNTKTRLISALGKVGAAEVHRQLMEQTVATSRDFALKWPADVEVCFAGGSKERMRQWLGPGMEFSPQAPGDVGNRMSMSFKNAFNRGYGRVVLVGTDIPEMTKRHLQDAFDALKEKDVVLGPSEDGGYWLIGLRQPVNMFCNIKWGSHDVLQKTLDLAKARSLSVYLLEKLSDVDTGGDLKKWKGGQYVGSPYLSVIIPALNEEKDIQECISSARDNEAEIIVVDGGSKDETWRRAEMAGATVISAHKGRASQQNAGVKRAGGKVLLFLHADTRVPANYVPLIFETLLPKGTVAGAFKFKTDGDGVLMRLVELNTNLRARLFQLPYGDQGLFMAKDTFEAAGRFPDTPIAEDLLLVRRLRLIGRIGIATKPAITSARRWHKLGVTRTTVINQVILAGILLGLPYHKLASLYSSNSQTSK